jgi:hypothetical protein
MKIFYWAPFNSRTGVVDKVLNSIQAINKYGNSNINITLLNANHEFCNGPTPKRYSTHEIFLQMHVMTMCMLLYRKDVR